MSIIIKTNFEVGALAIQASCHDAKAMEAALQALGASPTEGELADKIMVTIFYDPTEHFAPAPAADQYELPLEGRAE